VTSSKEGGRIKGTSNPAKSRYKKLIPKGEEIGATITGRGRALLEHEKRGEDFEAGFMTRIWGQL